MSLAERSIRAFLLVVAAFAAISTESVQAEQAGSPSVPAEKLPDSTLIYVSDYFSFIGVDNQGRVAFALDNNRGRDGEKYQAEHFVVLHDEHQGWVNVAGNGRYENTKKELARIPDSPFFQFENTPETGLTITSAKNQLTLRIEPLKQRTLRTHGKSTIWYGSAPAVLTWQGRTILGRVIYESLVMPDFNRLTRTYWGMWNEFQGFYLLAEGSNDIYLHSQQSERMAALAGKLVGFLVFNEVPELLNDLQVEVLDREFAPGFYRWPAAWRITWRGSKGPASMTLVLSRRKGIANWLIGGFSMGIVSGELSYDGRTWPVHGLAELIM
jgi:hypothetical protein